MTDFASIRQDLHCHPGISGDEHYAHDLIVRQLNACHPDAVFTHVGGFGVVAIWGTEPSRPTIAVRGDIDALPIGHRCGHDGHTTILLQLAEQISDKYPQTFNGINIILVFQPEEETGTGSQKIIDAGILQQYNIKAIYGFHNLPGFPLGTVVLNYHTFAAASTGVIYRTLRAFTNSSMQQLLAEANDIVNQTAARHHLQVAQTLRDPFLATENNSTLVEFVEQHCTCRQRHVLTPFRWSEDFANYLQLFPGAMFGIGSGEKQPELHHPDYNFPDALIKPAADILMNIISHFSTNTEL